MVSKDLVFRLFGEDVNASASLRKLSREAETSGKGIHKAFGDAPRDVTAIAVAAGAASVYMAAKFQTATTRLVTDAGESEKNLDRVRAGIESISDRTGISSDEIAKGMYLVESAGYHGAAGLKVMAAAAEGAKIGGADLSTVSDALTTAMTDYALPASKAAETTSKLIATVSNGKTTMEALAGSLHSVLPGAESAGLGLNQVLGAMATMTAEGISADQASENLNHAILSLQNPTQVQTKAMAAMGLSAHDVAKNLGKKGLTGTYEELTTAIASHIKHGDVVIDSFNRSKQAAAAAQAELKAMPSSIQSVAKAYFDGSMSQADWTKAMKAQTPEHANLLKQFSATAGAAHGFSDALRSGQGPFATYSSQLSKMTGGQVGLQVALHLTGAHAETLEHNVAAVGRAHAEAGGHVHDWATIQKTFNQQLAQAGTTLENIGIVLGTKLLPGLTTAATAFGGFLTDLVDGRAGATLIATSIGVFVLAMVALYTATKIYEGAAAAAKIALWGISVAQKAAGVATDLHSGAIYANITATIRSKAETAALYAMYARDSVVASAKAIGSFVATAAAATANAAKTGAVWVAQSARAAAGWVLMRAQAVAAFVATAASSVANGARIAAVWVAQKAAVLGYIAVQGLLRAATGLATVAQWALNVAMDANPIGIVVVAIAALVAGLVWFFTQTKVGQQAWSAFTKFIVGAWDAVVHWFQGAIANVVGFFVRFGPLILAAVAPFIGLPLLIISHWSQITAWFGKLPALIGGLLGDAGKWLINTGRDILGGLIAGAMKGLIKLGQWELKIGSAVIGWLEGAEKWLVDTGVDVLTGLRTGAITGLVKFALWVYSLQTKVTGWVAGAGKWLLDAGRHVIEGLVQGVQNAVGLATSAVKGVADSVVNTFKSVLGIHSPSRVFASLGAWIGKGLVNGLAGTSDAVHQAVSDLATKIVDGFSKMADQRKTAQDKLDKIDARFVAAEKDRPKLVADSEGKISAAREAAYQKALRHWHERIKAITAEKDAELKVWNSLDSAKAAKSKQSSLTKTIAADNTKLTALAAQRDSLGDLLKDATQKLADAQQAWADTQTSVSSSAFGTGNVVSSYQAVFQQHQDALTQIAQLKDQIAGLDPTSDTYGADQVKLGGQLAGQQSIADSTVNSTSQMTATLQGQIAKTQRFQADLKQLISMGIDPATYQQLVAGGISGGGLEAADDLISSGAGSVAQMADLQNQLQSASNSLGTDVANHLNLAGVQAAQGLVTGLNSQIDSVTAAMNKISDAMVAAVKKALDIHSPSRVMRRHGQWAGDGLVLGVKDRQSDAEQAMTALVNVPSRYATAPGSTGLPGQIPTASGQRALVHIENFHATPDQSPADIAADLGWLTRGGL